MAELAGSPTMISQTYDLAANALYITVTDHQVSRTAQIDTGTLVDLDAAGAIVGIEVLNFDRCWPVDEILERFHIAPENAEELRAYFSGLGQPVRPEHPAPRVPVSV
jgi:uncharacterized protein YuzE